MVKLFYGIFNIHPFIRCLHFLIHWQHSIPDALPQPLVSGQVQVTGKGVGQRQTNDKAQANSFCSEKKCIKTEFTEPLLAMTPASITRWDQSKIRIGLAHLRWLLLACGIGHGRRLDIGCREISEQVPQRQIRLFHLSMMSFW